MLGSQNQCGQPRVPSFGLVIGVHAEFARGIGDMLRNYSEVKRPFVKESTIHIILFLEQAL